jgi:hypothetical protein
MKYTKTDYIYNKFHNPLEQVGSNFHCFTFTATLSTLVSKLAELDKEQNETKVKQNYSELVESSSMYLCQSKSNRKSGRLKLWRSRPFEVKTDLVFMCQLEKPTVNSSRATNPTF